MTYWWYTRAVWNTMIWRWFTYLSGKYFLIYKMIVNKREKHRWKSFVLPKPSLGAHTLHGLSFCLITSLVSVAAEEMLNSFISKRSYNCWSCSISSLHLSQINYLPAILLQIIQNSASVEFALDFKNWIGIKPMEFKEEAIELTLC